MSSSLSTAEVKPHGFGGLHFEIGLEMLPLELRNPSFLLQSTPHPTQDGPEDGGPR